MDVLTPYMANNPTSSTEAIPIIMITCPCNAYPLTPHFYIVKLGFTGVYIIFLILLLSIDCVYTLEPPPLWRNIENYHFLLF